MDLSKEPFVNGTYIKPRTPRTLERRVVASTHSAKLSPGDPLPLSTLEGMRTLPVEGNDNTDYNNDVPQYTSLGF